MNVAVTVLVRTTVFRDLSHDPAPDVVGLEALPDVVDGVVDMAVAALELPCGR